MKSFKDFNISTTSKSFVGDKIKMSKIMNREITVYDYRIEDSKVFKTTASKCLYLQISLADEKHVVFTSSTGLMETIQQVKKEDFPFKTTIINDNERFLFS